MRWGRNPRMVGKVIPSAPAAHQIVEYPLSKPGAEDDITVGADGNVWVEQANDNTPGSTGSIARITPSGTVSEFTSGLLPNANQDNDHIISGPDGNLWFNDVGAKAIGKVSLDALADGQHRLRERNHEHDSNGVRIGRAVRRADRRSRSSTARPRRLGRR